MPTKSSAGCRTETALSYDKAVERVISAMQSQLDKTPSLEELAGIALMSLFHFDRVFHSVTGLPPRKFLRALRLEAAKRLLLTTDLSVLDICFEVGYSSLGSFSRRFNIAVGASPGEFRSLTEEGVGPLLELAAHDPIFRKLAGSPASSGPGIFRGRISAPPACDAPVFVGLFPSSVPEGQPAACAILERPGDFNIGPVPEGRYYLFAMALGGSSDWMHLHLYEDALLGALPRNSPVLIHHRRPIEGRVNLTLEPAPRLAPPILVSIPALLRQHVRKS